MKRYFTKEDIEEKIHLVDIEDDGLLLEGEWVEGEGKNYVIGGIATVDGERYHDFEIEFELLQEPKTDSLEELMSIDWDWYDYLCG